MLDRLIDSASDPAALATVLAVIAAAAAIYTVAAPTLQTNGLGARLKQVALRREELRRKSRAALEAKGKAGLRRNQGGAIADIVKKLDLAKALADDTIADKLNQAGLRGPAPLSAFYLFRFLMPIGFGVLSLLYVLAAKLAFNIEIAIVVCAVAAGFYAPNVYVTNLIAKRKQSIMTAFPDALDMLLICVESGMSIDLALQRVSAEVGSVSIALAEELSLTCAELSYLPDRRQAYENLAKRTDHPGVKSVATALVQAERYGTPLGQALRVMAKENRDLRLTEAEKKAAALPAQLTVPMIVFFLPVLFAVILTPAFIQVSRTTGGG